MVPTGRKLRYLLRRLKEPKMAIGLIVKFFDEYSGITERAQATDRGERVVVSDWQSGKDSGDFVTLAHIQRYEWVTSHLRGRQCLDAGCGSGYGTYYVAERVAKTVLGVDSSESAIAYATKRYKRDNLSYLQMDVCDLSFRDSIFDAVISFDVLEHLNDKQQMKFLSEVRRVMRNEGILYLGTPNAEVSIGENPHHPKELTKEELERLCNRYFGLVTISGQDLKRNGVRQGARWYEYVADISYNDLIMVDSDCEYVFGLLATCELPRRV